MTYDPHTTGPVVVGIDGSRCAILAAKWAATEAAARQVELRLVHVVADADTELRAAQQALTVAAAAARTVEAVEVETAVAVGRPHSSLLSQSHSATMVVVGSVGVGFLPRMLLGSTAAALAAGASCPVALVREDHRVRPRSAPVIVGVNGTHLDDTLVGASIHEARIRGTHVLAVRAEYSIRRDPHGDRELGVADNFEEEIRGRAERWQTAIRGVHVDTLVRQGSAAEELSTLSRHGQLLVVGSRGRGAVAGTVLGSTSQSLIYHARCSVLVYRGHI